MRVKLNSSIYFRTNTVYDKGLFFLQPLCFGNLISILVCDVWNIRCVEHVIILVCDSMFQTSSQNLYNTNQHILYEDNYGRFSSMIYWLQLRFLIFLYTGHNCPLDYFTILNDEKRTLDLNSRSDLFKSDDQPRFLGYR